MLWARNKTWDEKKPGEQVTFKVFELLTHNWKVYELMENMLMETNCIMCFSFSKISKIQNTKLAKGFIVGQITWLYVIFSCILITKKMQHCVVQLKILRSQRNRRCYDNNKNQH